MFGPATNRNYSYPLGLSFYVTPRWVSSESKSIPKILFRPLKKLGALAKSSNDPTMKKKNIFRSQELLISHGAAKEERGCFHSIPSFTRTW